MKEKSQTRFFPSKKLGQNFLIDNNILEKIYKLGKVTADDTVIEIGPGKGALTEYIAENANKVVAIEKDTRLFDYLESQFKASNNIIFVNRDILDINLGDYFTGEKIKLISNEKKDV